MKLLSIMQVMYHINKNSNMTDLLNTLTITMINNPTKSYSNSVAKKINCQNPSANNSRKRKHAHFHINAHFRMFIIQNLGCPDSPSHHGNGYVRAQRQTRSNWGADWSKARCRCRPEMQRVRMCIKPNKKRVGVVMQKANEIIIETRMKHFTIR